MTSSGRSCSACMPTTCGTRRSPPVVDQPVSGMEGPPSGTPTLIRALLDVGGMKVAEIADVLTAIDDPVRPLHKVLGAAADRLATADTERDDTESAAAHAVVADLISRRGWQAHESAPAAVDLSKAIAARARLGHEAFVEVLDDYADAAEQIARADLAYVDRRVAVEGMVESVVIGTVLGEAVFSALRRLAHVDASAKLYGTEGPPERTTG
ncbi:MerR family transcriptional regulator [Streptomyces klenkii]|uniref:MerR family transcriptional regulator n=1 Tax=Streptomyces klenkii TaxID=1420899 RepID=UPI0036E35A4A